MLYKQFGIRELCAGSIAFVALFLYMFNVLPIIGPEKVGTREYLSVLASFFILTIITKLPRMYFGLIIANWTQIFFSIITVVLNGTDDYWYIQFAIRNILYINGAVLIAYLMPKKWAIESLLFFIVTAVFVNDIISFLGFINSKILSFIISIQSFSDMERTERTIGFANRVIGIGRNSYFNGGVNNGMAIILVFYLICKKKINQSIGLILVFVMTIIGLFIARTVIVGLLLGGGLYFLTQKKITRLIYFVFSIIALMVIFYASGILDGLNTSHAFEVFKYYDELDKVESLKSLNRHYDRNIGFYTVLIGDGLSKIGDSYYMHTDVGYMRNIFYFGIMGTLFGYLYYEYYILRKLYDQNRELKLLIYVLTIYLLVLNLKGLPDYNFYIFLMLSYYIRRNNIFSNSEKKQYRRRMRVYQKINNKL